MSFSEGLPQNAVIKCPNLASLAPELGQYAQVNELATQMERARIPEGQATLGELMEDKAWECEVLAPGNIWRKGLLRLKVEIVFLPDEPESQQSDSPHRTLLE